MKRHRMVLTALVLLVISCEPIVRTDNGGKVIKVKDGDSIVLLDKEKKEVEIRLAHIDAPEYSQPYGRASKEYLSGLIADEQVDYRIYEPRDRYGRIVAEVYIHDSVNVNREMVRLGYAWHFKRYSNNFSYHRLERSARQAGLGLWADQNSIPPWEWRKH